MIKTERTVTVTGGKELFVRIMEPEEVSPKAVIQIIHGVGEHSGRYERFAEFLTCENFAVVAHDHRGHGNTDPHQLGYIESDDGFRLMVSDIDRVVAETERLFPGIPLILFGHSMGSFLSQRYMQLYESKASGIIYSGSNGKPTALIYAGLWLAKLMTSIMGPDYKSSLIRNITFGPYNALFKPNRTRHDWLSRDPDEVDSHVEDPFCGFLPTVSCFRDLFSGLLRLHRHTPFAGLSPDVPVLIISGSKDPVSMVGGGIKGLADKLQKSGVEALTVKIYDDARHELLNEINRTEVMTDIEEWIERVPKYETKNLKLS